MRVVDAKSLRKTRESGEVWARDLSTGRCLPSGDGAIVAVDDDGPLTIRLSAPAGIANDATRANAEEVDGEAPRGTATGATETAPARGGEPHGAQIGAALARLEGVIEARRRERPEGSYTTYLFEAGEAKIRKKTGEEAIEVVLADSDESLVSEAADLIYHLMVLFAARGLSLEALAYELESRG